MSLPGVPSMQNNASAYSFIRRLDTDADVEIDLPIQPYLEAIQSTGNDSNSAVELPKDWQEATLVDPTPLGRQTDPFSPREGKTLTWRNVNMTLAGTEDEPERHILSNAWGEVPKQQTTAIMGPSGASKTSLLNVLSGRTVSRGRLSVSCDVRLDNFAVDPSNVKVRQAIAFVAQDDSLLATATPREAIRFSARLRLPRSTTDQELDALTHRMLTELGLLSCADTIVGGPLLKGISGGERKRTSVGVELVVKPAMVFLDEPTSGLDSFSAVQVCQVLKKVAQAGASVLFTIHQPSSEIFFSFDHLILLNKGRVMYQGPVDSVAQSFGDECGYPCPMNYNPADWILTVSQANSMADLERAGFFPKDERALGEAVLAREGMDPLARSVHGRSQHYEPLPPGFGVQVYLLFEREFQRTARDKTVVGARMIQSLVMSMLVGFIFLGVGVQTPALSINIQSQFGAVMIVCMLAALGTAQPAILSFPDERPIFLREYSTNHYSVSSYFASRFTMEALVNGIQVFLIVYVDYYMIGFQAPFAALYFAVYALSMASSAGAVLVGCVAGGDAKLAIQLLPLVFTPQLLFSGFFVAPSLIPVALRWIQYICVLTYGIRIILIQEFEDCSDDPLESASCSLLLDNVEADPNEVKWYWAILVGLFVFFRLVALWMLQQSAKHFY